MSKVVTFVKSDDRQNNTKVAIGHRITQTIKERKHDVYFKQTWKRLARVTKDGGIFVEKIEGKKKYWLGYFL